MKESMLVIQETGCYHIGPLLKVTDGQVCRKRLRNMLGSAINPRDLSQVSIN